MEMVGYQKSYGEYKVELDAEVSRAATSFVRIGYLLKVARDTGVLHGSPYGNVVDFAQAEYGIDKTQVSRFIGINDRFSEGGYSDRLQDKYRGYGVAKLALMLQLPDAVNEILSPSYSKAEIQAVKEEVDAEGETTDLEVMMEARQQDTVGDGNRAGTPYRASDLLHRAIWKLGEDEPGLYCGVYRAIQNGGQVQALQEALAPDGERTYSIRIAGVGRVLLSLRDGDGEVALVNIRTGEKVRYTWADVEGAWRATMPDAATAGEGWQAAYGREMPGGTPEPVGTWGSGEKTVPERRGQKKRSGKVVKAGAEGKKLGKGTGDKKGHGADVGTGKTGMRRETAGTAGNHMPDVPGTVETKAGHVGDSADDAASMAGAIPGQMGVRDYPELLPDGGAAEPGSEPKTGEVAPVQPGGGSWETEMRREECLRHLCEKLEDLYRAAVKGAWGQADCIMGEIGGILTESRALGW